MPRAQATSNERIPAVLNPFPGLRPFNEDEQHLFFGREGQVDTMLEKLASHHFLAVVGTSGSGKSSLVNCGLKPALRRGLMAAAGTSWRMVQLRPGGDPNRALARALAEPGALFRHALPSTGPSLEEILQATLQISVLGLIDVYDQAHLAPGTNLLIVVDQFEELFRYHLVGDETRQLTSEGAVEFVNLLLQAASSDRPIYIVITMRSDFLGDCARFIGLPEAINKGEYLVPRMTRDERRSAISGPIMVAGAEISSVLLTRLVNDVGDNPDQLSILQHALNRTWAQWERESNLREPITVSHYEAVGTMESALDRHADKAYSELSARQKSLCERLFKTLTDKGSDARGVRRPTKLSALCAIADSSTDEMVAVIDVFRKRSRSFLMPPLPEKLGPETVIDISHESLMRVWKRLREWANGEAASSAQYLRLAENARLYSQGTIGLLTDPELALVLEWRKATHLNSAWAEQYNGYFTEAMQFLDRSEAKRDLELAERERARKKKFRQVQTVAGILVALTILALYSAWTARREKLRAETNLALAKKAVDESLSSAGRRQAQEAGNLPEVEELRKELLDKAAAFYTEFTRQSPRSESLAVETARAHSRLGDINRLLGKHQDAVQEYQVAISKLQELVNNRPAKPEYLQALGYAYNWLGETIRSWWETSPGNSHYNWTDAEKKYDLALGVQQQLHDQSPGDSLAQQELARTYYNRGIIRFDGRNKEGAESDFRTAIALLEPLSGKQLYGGSATSLPDPQQELARSYNNLANVLKASNPQQALPLYQQAIDLTRTLSTAHPDDREYRVELAEYLNNQAIALMQTNQDLDLAEQRNYESIHLLEQLITPSPSLSMDLAKSLEVRTEIVTDRGSEQVALEESDRLFELLGRLRDSSAPPNHPELHVFYMNLGINYAALAKTQIDSGDIRGAEVALEKLARVLPEVSAADRETLTAESRKLRNQLEGRTSK